MGGLFGKKKSSGDTSAAPAATETVNRAKYVKQQEAERQQGESTGAAAVKAPDKRLGGGRIGEGIYTKAPLGKGSVTGSYPVQ